MAKVQKYPNVYYKVRKDVKVGFTFLPPSVHPPPNSRCTLALLDQEKKNNADPFFSNLKNILPALDADCIAAALFLLIAGKREYSELQYRVSLICNIYN
jgi:hypothetical protein